MIILNSIINTFKDLVSILTWPLVVIILILVLLLKYRNAIDKFIRNIGTIKGPGGMEVIQKQSFEPKTKKNLSEREELNKKISELSDELKKKEIDIDAKDKLIKEAIDIFDFLTSEVERYQFLHLHQFFVPATKNILGWFSDVKRITRELYYHSWRNIIKDEKQLNLILALLISERMIQEIGNERVITDLGIRFLKYEKLI